MQWWGRNKNLICENLLLPHPLSLFHSQPGKGGDLLLFIYWLLGCNQKHLGAAIKMENQMMRKTGGEVKTARTHHSPLLLFYF